MKMSRLVGSFLFCFFAQSAFAQACVPTEQEKAIWDGIKQSSEPLEFLAYLNEFPAGCFRTLAKFKIRSLVPASVPLQASFLFTADDTWRTAKEGQWLDYGDGRPVEMMKFRAEPTDPNKFQLQYQCDAAGVGLTDWIAGDKTCADRRAPIQGFSLRMRGVMRDFYDLKVQCSTHRRPDNSGQVDYDVGEEGWCGVRAGTPSTYTYRANTTVLRKKAFDD